MKKHHINNKKTAGILSIVGIIMAIVICFGIANSVAEDNVVAEAFPPANVDVLGERIDDCTHENTSEIILNEGLCGERKESKLVCDDCGAHISTYIGVVTQHNWENVLSEPATCQNEGKTVDKCSICGEERTLVPIKSVSDNSLHNVEVMVTEATCLKPSMEVEYCVDCNTVFSSREVAPAHGHKAGAYVTVREANCTEGSRSVSYCTVCNFVMDTKTTEANGHDYEAAVVIASICTYEGYELYKCNDCGHEKKVSIKVNPDAHTSVSVERTEPTCETDGSVKSVCNDCGKVLKEEIIPALGHTDGVWETISEGDCTHGIEKTHYCGRCKMAFEFMMSTPLGHEWKTVEVVSSDCTTNGYVRQECTVCGEEQRIALPPSHGHVEGPEECVNDPSSEYYGAIVTHCEVCGEIVKVTMLAPPIEAPDPVELTPPVYYDGEEYIYGIEEEIISEEAIDGVPIVSIDDDEEIVSNEPSTTPPAQDSVAEEDVVVEAD